MKFVSTQQLPASFLPRLKNSNTQLKVKYRFIQKEKFSSLLYSFFTPQSPEDESHSAYCGGAEELLPSHISYEEVQESFASVNHSCSSLFILSSFVQFCSCKSVINAFVSLCVHHCECRHCFSFHDAAAQVLTSTGK